METYSPLPAPIKPPTSPLRWIGLALWIAAAALLFQLMQTMALYQPIPGTRLWLGAGLSAAAHAVMIALLLASWRLARIGDFRTHGRIQTAIVMANWLTIVFVMGLTFMFRVYFPDRFPDPYILLESFHGLAGGVVALLATYLIIRMTFFRILPPWLKVRRTKRLMQVTMVAWLLVAIGGLMIFAMKYLL